MKPERFNKFNIQAERLVAEMEKTSHVPDAFFGAYFACTPKSNSSMSDANQLLHISQNEWLTLGNYLFETNFPNFLEAEVAITYAHAICTLRRARTKISTVNEADISIYNSLSSVALKRQKTVDQLLELLEFRQVAETRQQLGDTLEDYLIESQKCCGIYLRSEEQLGSEKSHKIIAFVENYFTEDKNKNRIVLISSRRK